jgi:type II secretory pathway component GspD/PulD (secretin)
MRIMAHRNAVSIALGAACFLLLSAAGAQAAEEPQVVLEVRLLSVSDESFERIGVDFNVNPPAKQGPQDAPKRGQDVDVQKLGLTFLSDLQVHQLLEAAQGDRRTNIMQLPRLTLRNNQRGTVESTETRYFMTGVEWVPIEGQACLRPKWEPIKIGFNMVAKPVVSADRRFVQLAFEVNQTELASANTPLLPVQIPVPRTKIQLATEKSTEPVLLQMFLQQPQLNTMAIEKTVTIPDGRTVVFGSLKKTTETRDESGPPILSKIPYVSRLFRNVGYGRETQTLWVMVTPRILVNEEKEVATASESGLKQASWKTEPLAAPRQQAPCAKSTDQQGNVVDAILRAYDQACATGHTEEAERLARAALILNPTCFRERR